MQPITVSVGPNAAAATSSPWIRLDSWAGPIVSKQTVVSGTVNYTVQFTMDDPNSPTNPVAVGSVTWVNDPDTSFVGATTGGLFFSAFPPIFMRVVMNSGTGTVTLTVAQISVVPF